MAVGKGWVYDGRRGEGGGRQSADKHRLAMLTRRWIVGQPMAYGRAVLQLHGIMQHQCGPKRSDIAIA